MVAVAIDGNRDEPTIDVTQGIDACHGLLAEVTALRKRNRPLVTAQFLRQRLLGKIDRLGNAGLDASGLPCCRHRPRHVLEIQPGNQPLVVGRLHLHDKSHGAVPINPYDRHRHIAQEAAAVLEQCLRRLHAQSRRQPCLRLRARDDKMPV